jgi:hypothetical protein
MVRFMKETRQSMRRSTRETINKLITIQVSSIIKMPLLYSLVMEAESIQVTSMAKKYANKSFLSWLGGFFPYLSLRVERWLCIGWVVSFGGFECVLFFAVVGARNKHGSTLLTLLSHLSKPTPNLYVDLIGLSSTWFKLFSIIFLLTIVLPRREVK